MTKVYINVNELLAALGEGKDLNRPKGFAYNRGEKQGRSAFINTNRKTGEVTRHGDNDELICINLK